MGVYQLLDGLLREKGFSFEKDSDSYQLLANELLKAQLGLVDFEINQAAGKPELAPEDQQTVSNSSPQTSFKEIADGFWSENSENWKPRTRTQYKTTHNRLIEFIGEDTPLNRLNYQKGRDYKEALSKSKTPAGKAMAKSRVDLYLGYASTLFNWAIKQHYTELNPFAGLQYGKKAQKRADKQREAFTKSDLRLLFVESDYHGKDKWRHSAHLHLFWLPILGLFTGARLEELGQLYVSDVKKVSGVYCLHIREKQPDQSVKTSEERLIPLHDFLVKDLGFLRYVSGLPKKGRVFPELKPVDGKYTHGFSMWFSKQVKRCGIKGAKTFHSLRHTLTTHLLEQDIPVYRIAQLIGHADESQTTGRYGKRFQPDKLKEKVIDKIDFGIDLSHLKKSRFVVK